MVDGPQQLDITVTDATDRGSPSPEMVGERYWLRRGVKILDESATSVQAGAQSAVSAAAWFWSTYTAVVIVGLSVLDRSLSGWTTVVVVAPILLLSVAYLLAQWAAAPIRAEFDGDFPEAIRRIHNESIEKKWGRLRAAHLFVGLASISIAIAIPLAIASGDGQQLAGLQAAYVQQVDESAIAVRVEVPDAVDLTVSIAPDGRQPEVVVVPDDREVPFERSFKVPQVAEYLVTVAWTSGPQQYEVSELIKPDD